MIYVKNGPIAQLADPSADGLLSFMYYSYVLRNELSDKIYIGQTENIEKRLREHNNKELDKRAYTKLNKGKWVLVYKEVFNSRKEAVSREKELKSSRGRDFIRKTIMGR